MIGEAEDLDVSSTSIFKEIEKTVLKRKELSLSEACLLGAGFGEQGSAELFKKLEEVVAANYAKLGLEEFKLVLRGLVFNRRISVNFLKALKKK